jgi:PE family
VIRRTLTIGSVAFTLHGIGSVVSAGNAAEAGPTAGVVPAAADEVSALRAAQFGAHAQMYQDFIAQGAAIHEQFVTPWRPAPGPTWPSRPANAAAAG